MARRTRSHTRFVRPAPKTKVWIGGGVGQTTIVATTVQLIQSLSAGALLLRPFTILRSRLLINFESDQAAVTERAFGTFGSIVVSDQAVAAGAASIPDPGTIAGDPDADWFVSQAVQATFGFLSSVGFHPQSAGPGYVIDSKAMRKVGPNQDIAGMFSSESNAGALLTIQGRLLIQLH